MLTNVQVSIPFYVTATALGKLGNPEGEVILTRAAEKHNVIQMVSHQFLALPKFLLMILRSPHSPAAPSMKSSMQSRGIKFSGFNCKTPLGHIFSHFGLSS